MNSHLYKDAIQYNSPDISQLVNQGYHPVDMHLHTIHSDGVTKVQDLLRYAKNRKIGVAITDHNKISGSLEALSRSSDVLIIPGTELETKEGPHLLFYFYSPGDMEDFFKVFSNKREEHTPGLPKNLTVIECLQLAESFDCIRIAAHPFGYYGINRGVLKCVEKQMLPGVLNHIDGIEVICGGMMHNLNLRAIAYARKKAIPFTGGSDAHILSDVGNVVTAVKAESAEEFLDGIKKMENLVIGKPGGYIAKGATAGVIAWSFVPYSITRLGTYYSVHKCRASHMVSSYRRRFARLSQVQKSEKRSEERRE
ncbi:PHP domain-containing protein [Methanospirillum sp.]|uniref:PHP domain-containing protein n=1 Tax=Methanospirillum sp. TaxID=45200 RepID=UPI0029841211|nr:PHP-associated domain-containing protein [Methanospirillum sp.]